MTPGTALSPTFNRSCTLFLEILAQISGNSQIFPQVVKKSQKVPNTSVPKVDRNLGFRISEVEAESPTVLALLLTAGTSKFNVLVAVGNRLQGQKRSLR